MSGEKHLIRADKTPLSQTMIADELRAMGLGAGDLVMLHASMRNLGWVIGGAQAVLAALFDVLGRSGTLVMPGFSSQISDPASWNSPPVPDNWVAKIRDQMPLFDPDITPIRGIGVVAQTLHAMRDTRRSDHPRDSFLAHGPLAGALLDDHPLANSLGRGAPLGKMYERGAKVLLLGAGFDACTCFHLAEDGLPGIDPVSESYPYKRENGVTHWETILQPPTFEEHFAQIGSDFCADSTGVTTGFHRAAHLFPMRAGVEFARAALTRLAGDGKLT